VVVFLASIHETIGRVAAACALLGGVAFVMAGINWLRQEVVRPDNTSVRSGPSNPRLGERLNNVLGAYREAMAPMSHTLALVFAGTGTLFGIAALGALIAWALTGG
jgi:hypothetical protein